MHEIIKIVAKYFIVLAAVGAALAFLRMPKKDRIHYVALILLGGALSFLLAKIGSHFYNDPRPFVQGHFTPLLSHANDNGFPSDHTLLAAVFGFAALQYSRKIGSAVLLVALLVGLSRMAAGVHHSWDILGSLAFAALGCYGAVYALRFIPEKVWRKSTVSTK